MMLPISETITYWNMPFKEGAGVLCALSGGRDSVAMVHALKDLSSSMGFSLICMHVNHRLRGAESDRDEAFCVELCEKLGVELVCAPANVTRYAEEKNIGIEQSARELRYSLLESYADRLGCTLIATAHTADDNAETVLFNLIRGSTLAGLCGIPPVRGRIVRPMIECPRELINDYIAANSLEFVEDSTNAEDIYTRNRIRKRIMPEAFNINPDFPSTLSRNIRLLRSQRDIVALREAEAATNIYMDRTGCHIPADTLAALPPALRGSVILTMGEMLGAPFGSTHASLALSALEDKTGRKTIGLPGGFWALSRDGIFTVTARPPVPFPPFPERTISEDGYVMLADGGEIICQSAEPSAKIHNSANIFYLDRAKIGDTLVLRPRKAGDKMRKNKHSGRSTLKKLMIEAGIPADIREALAVVSDDSGAVLACEGIGANCDFMADGESPSLKIEIRRRSYNDK